VSELEDEDDEEGVEEVCLCRFEDAAAVEDLVCRLFPVLVEADGVVAVSSLATLAALAAATAAADASNLAADLALALALALAVTALSATVAAAAPLAASLSAIAAADTLAVLAAVAVLAATEASAAAVAVEGVRVVVCGGVACCLLCRVDRGAYVGLDGFSEPAMMFPMA
jgi:hypothetical protein